MESSDEGRESRVETGVGLFFQNFQRNFIQDLREGYWKAFNNTLSNMFMIRKCGKMAVVRSIIPTNQKTASSILPVE